MLITSTKLLKEALREAQDHKIVIERQNEKGDTYYNIPYPPQLLQKIVDDNLE